MRTGLLMGILLLVMAGMVVMAVGSSATVLLLEIAALVLAAVAVTAGIRLLTHMMERLTVSRSARGQPRPAHVQRGAPDRRARLRHRGDTGRDGIPARLYSGAIAVRRDRGDV